MAAGWMWMAALKQFSPDDDSRAFFPVMRPTMPYNTSQKGDNGTKSNEKILKQMFDGVYMVNCR